MVIRVLRSCQASFIRSQYVKGAGGSGWVPGGTAYSNLVFAEPNFGETLVLVGGCLEAQDPRPLINEAWSVCSSI